MFCCGRLSSLMWEGGKGQSGDDEALGGVVVFGHENKYRVTVSPM